MRALLFNENRTFEVTEVDDPQPSKGEVLVSIAYAGICGSDIKGSKEGGRRTPPLIMGHEFSGLTNDGRRVAIIAMVGCENCQTCHRGTKQLCRNREVIGVHRSGGLAEMVAVPARAVVDLPQSVSLEQGALIEPLAVVLRAWRHSRAGAGSTVGVIGSGNIGLMVLEVARHFGAEVDLVDPLDERLEVARGHGARNTGATLEGEYDVVFDAVGITETHSASVAHLVPGGAAVWIAAHTSEPGFDALDLYSDENHVMTSLGYTPEEFGEAAELVGELNLDWYRVRPLDEGAAAINDLVQGRSIELKVLLQP